MHLALTSGSTNAAEMAMAPQDKLGRLNRKMAHRVKPRRPAAAREAAGDASSSPLRVTEPDHRRAAPACFCCALPALLRADEAPRAMLRPGVTAGYRGTGWSLRQCTLSALQLNNETVNIHSHLFPALYFAWQAIEWAQDLYYYRSAVRSQSQQRAHSHRAKLRRAARSRRTPRFSTDAAHCSSSLVASSSTSPQPSTTATARIPRRRHRGCSVSISLALACSSSSA
jgi:hypothetical protein